MSEEVRGGNQNQNQNRIVAGTAKAIVSEIQLEDLPGELLEHIGQVVRQVWVEFQFHRQNTSDYVAPPHHLLPFEKLDGPNQQVDRLIGGTCFAIGWNACVQQMKLQEQPVSSNVPQTVSVAVNVGSQNIQREAAPYSPNEVFEMNKENATQDVLGRFERYLDDTLRTHPLLSKYGPMEPGNSASDVIKQGKNPVIPFIKGSFLAALVESDPYLEVMDNLEKSSVQIIGLSRAAYEMSGLRQELERELLLSEICNGFIWELKQLRPLSEGSRGRLAALDDKWEQFVQGHIRMWVAEREPKPDDNQFQVVVKLPLMDDTGEPVLSKFELESPTLKKLLNDMHRADYQMYWNNWRTFRQIQVALDWGMTSEEWRMLELMIQKGWVYWNDEGTEVRWYDSKRPMLDAGWQNGVEYPWYKSREGGPWAYKSVLEFVRVALQVKNLVMPELFNETEVAYPLCWIKSEVADITSQQMKGYREEVGRYQHRYVAKNGNVADTNARFDFEQHKQQVSK